LVSSYDFVVMSRLVAFVTNLGLLIGLLNGSVGSVALQNPAHQVPARGYRTLTRDYRINHVAVIGDSYTAGTDEGGLGPQSWTACALRTLAARGVRVAADVAAEGRAGYGVPGDRGSVFADLTARAVKPANVLVVFFGSRNDQGVAPGLLTERARDTFDLARRLAPTARFLVIGPLWPTADVPDSLLRVRDVLNVAARAAGAAFVDPIGAGWFVDRPDLISVDGVHPNDEGHAYLADKIAPLIRMQLSR
jgi:lysophospholipase L1-like esterase